MKTILVGLLLGGVGVFAAGCRRNLESREAVQRAVVAYLAERGMNVGSMQIEVVSVSFRGGEADAIVHIAPKGASGAPSVTMKYVLERRVDRWLIKSRSEAAETPHGQPGPPGDPPPSHPQVPLQEPSGIKK